MILEDIGKIKSGEKELRSFAKVMGIACALISGLLFWRGHTGYLYFLIPAPVFLTLGWLAPGWLKPIQKVWMTAALCIGWVMTRVILSALFFLVVTPIGILVRVTGKRFMDLKIDPRAETYWKKRDPSEYSQTSCEKQY